ncbi:C-type lectin mannose-binding isoform-like [Ambystoma mexicanum]|uniref:C-type lectin mannose-binding isoform-like n=1 Tax=Ambystoma mexicanum TaxID=8296 RepID=UPI0037E8450E
MKSLVIMLSLLGLSACRKLEVMPEDAVVDASVLGPCSKINTSDSSCCPICGIHDWARIGNVCYKLFNCKTTFANAELYCRRRIRGGRLASLHTCRDNRFVSRLLRHGPATAWIGGLYLHQGKTFIWSDGSEFNYQNWSPGEPNNCGRNEFCMEIYGNGKWNDLACNRARAFICEYRLGRREDQVEEEDQAEVKELE